MDSYSFESTTLAMNRFLQLIVNVVKNSLIWGIICLIIITVVYFGAKLIWVDIAYRSAFWYVFLISYSLLILPLTIWGWLATPWIKHYHQELESGVKMEAAFRRACENQFKPAPDRLLRWLTNINAFRKTRW